MLRFALIGCGRIAKRHAELLAGRQIAGAELAAVCDVVPSKAEQFGTRFSVPWFEDMHRLMKSIRPDVVVVLTESGRHAEHVIALAQYRCDVMVEKPMALTLDDADAMIRPATPSGYGCLS